MSSPKILPNRAESSDPGAGRIVGSGSSNNPSPSQTSTHDPKPDGPKTGGPAGRTEARFQVGDPTDFGANLFRLNDDSFAFPLECRMTDFHLGGCALKYQSHSPIPSQIARLHFQIEKLSIDAQVVGRVRWSRLTGMGTYHSGFEFGQPLPPAVIDRMLREKKVTRRVHRRKQIDASVTVRQSTPHLVCPNARLVSISLGGAQVWTNRPLAVNSRLLLALPGGITAVANTVWSVENGENDYSTGVAFNTVDHGKRLYSAFA